MYKNDLLKIFPEVGEDPTNQCLLCLLCCSGVTAVCDMYIQNKDGVKQLW